jgi:hypothetical protein
VRHVMYVIFGIIPPRDGAAPTVPFFLEFSRFLCLHHSTSSPGISNKIIVMQWTAAVILALTAFSAFTRAVEPNFEDIHDAKEESQNEVVNIDQDSPHSNAIHIAHNIPTGSDITVTQKSPFNSTVHIALNIGKDCKVKVDMSGAVNSVLHVSLSNARQSTVDVTMNNAVNCSIHLRYYCMMASG